MGQKISSTKRRRLLLTLLGIVLCSLLLGWGLAQLTSAQLRPTAPNISPLESPTPRPVQPPTRENFPARQGTVDVVFPRFQLGQEVYIETCGSCHFAIPPAVLPTETWRTLISEPQHYGTVIQPLVNPARLLVWQYLLTYSRSVNEGEEIPYRLERSRYFTALHPRVKMPQPLNWKSCAICHPSSAQFDFRRLAPEWVNSP